MNRALIVVDIQKGFITSLTKHLPSKIRNYILEHKDNYKSIVFTRYINHEKSNFVKILGWKGFMSDRQTAIIKELREFVTSKNLFIKYTYGSFVDNKLLSHLKQNNIKEVDIVGIDTENCVLTFARDAFDRGFKVRVLKNLCGSHSSKKLHKAALEIIKNNIGDLG